MSTLKKIGNKLFKTELASHEVKLALVDDLNNIISEAERVINLQEDGLKWYQKAKDAHTEFLKQLTDSIGVIQSSEKYIPKLIENILSTTAKASKQAQDLGLDVKQIKGYVEALKLSGKLSDNSGRSKDLLKELQKYNKL